MLCLSGFELHVYILVGCPCQLPREAKKCPSFYFCSLVSMSNTFLRILADPKRAHLWISWMDVSTPMVLRFSFNLSGIVPNAPTTMGITFVLTPHIFWISLTRSNNYWYFSTFSSSFALTLAFIIWNFHVYNLAVPSFSMINRSSLLAPIS